MGRGRAAGGRHGGSVLLLVAALHVLYVKNRRRKEKKRRRKEKRKRKGRKRKEKNKKKI
jgi:hypothetical protein